MESPVGPEPIIKVEKERMLHGPAVVVCHSRLPPGAVGWSPALQLGQLWPGPVAWAAQPITPPEEDDELDELDDDELDELLDEAELEDDELADDELADDELLDEEDADPPLPPAPLEDDEDADPPLPPAPLEDDEEPDPPLPPAPLEDDEDADPPLPPVPLEEEEEADPPLPPAPLEDEEDAPPPPLLDPEEVLSPPSPGALQAPDIRSKGVHRGSQIHAVRRVFVNLIDRPPGCTVAWRASAIRPGAPRYRRGPRAPLSTIGAHAVPWPR